MKLKTSEKELDLNQEFDVTLTLADLILISIATGNMSMYVFKQSIEDTHLTNSEKYFTQKQIDVILNSTNEIYKNGEVYNETLEIIKKVVDKSQ